MSYLGIPKHNFIDYNSYQLGYNQSIRRHYKQYHDQPTYLEIIKKIDENEAFQSMKGQKVIFGGMVLEAHANIFAEWYLYYANEFGIEKADEYLNNYFTRRYNTCQVVLWITGIIVEHTIELEDGIKIVPLTEMPMYEEKMIYERLQLDELPFHVFPKCAIVGTYTSPKFESEYESFKSKGNSLHQLMIIAYSINLLNEMICAPYFSTYYCDNPSFFISGGGTVHQGYQTSFSNKSIDSSHVKEINEIYNSLFQLPEKKQNIFMTSINRILLSKCQRNLDDKILDLCIALEMLLLSDSGKGDPVALPFRLRGAWLIGESSEQRKSYYKDLNDLYGYRSNVAHNGFLTDKPIKHKEITEVFPRYLDLAERIIKKIIKDGTPDWTNLILYKVSDNK